MTERRFLSSNLTSNNVSIGPLNTTEEIHYIISTSHSSALAEKVRSLPEPYKWIENGSVRGIKCKIKFLGEDDSSTFFTAYRVIIEVPTAPYDVTPYDVTPYEVNLFVNKKKTGTIYPPRTDPDDKTIADGYRDGVYRGDSSFYVGDVTIYRWPLGLEFRFAANYTNVKGEEKLSFLSSVVVHYVTQNGKLYTGGAPLPPGPNRTFFVEDQRITILTATEVIWGQNMMLAWFKSTTGEWLRRPRLTGLIDAYGCSLINKFGSTDLRGVDSGNIVAYGMLRYFLWYLITNKWCIGILRRRYTRHFFKTLAESSYSKWVNVFSEAGLSGYDKYYVY